MEGGRRRGVRRRWLPGEWRHVSACVAAALSEAQQPRAAHAAAAHVPRAADDATALVSALEEEAEAPAARGSA